MIKHSGLILLFVFMIISMEGEAQQLPQPNSEQQKFLQKCNPTQQQNLNKACNCLMQTVAKAMPLQEFNSLDEREKAGQVVAGEVQNKTRLISTNKAYMDACMKQL